MNDQNVAPFEPPEGGFPPGFEPQVPLAPNSDGGIQERDRDLIADAELEEPEVQPVDPGDADGGDDEADE